MSDLIAVAYPDQATAEEVRSKLIELQRGHVIEMEDLVVVTREQNGKVKLHQTANPTAAGAASGALWGTLIGLLFFAPLLGTVIGAASGAAGGALTDLGVDDNFLKQLGQKLSPGAAATIVLVRKVTADKVLPEIAGFGGEVIQSSLTDEGEQRLQEALDTGASPAQADAEPAPSAGS